MKTVSVRLDESSLKEFEEVLRDSRSDVVRNLVKAGQKQKAVELYSQGKVSLGRGARLAGVTLGEFIDLLKEHRIGLNLEDEDLEASLETARKAL